MKALRRAESPSSIELYHTCPMAYRLRYVDGVPPADFPYLEVGRVFHELAAQYAAHCIGRGLPSDREYLMEAAARAAAGLPFDRRGDFLELCRGLAGLAFPADGGAECLIERRMGLSADLVPCGYEDAACMLRGITDFAAVYPDRVEFWDYKTSYRIPPRSEVPVQAAAYAVLLGVLFPGRRVDAVFRYVRYGTERRWRFEPEQIPDMAAYFRSVIERMQGGKAYPARVSSECERCAFAYACPELERMAGRAGVPLHPLTPDEAAELAREYRALQVRLRLLEEKLRRYCEENGPVVLEDAVLGYQLRQVRSVEDARAVVELLRSAGVPEEEIWKVVSISVRELDGLLRRVADGRIRDMVLEHVRADSRVEFRWTALGQKKFVWKTEA